MAPRADAPVYRARPPSRRSRLGELPLTDAITSYERQLRAENKSRETIDRVYGPRLRRFAQWLADAGMPTSLEGIKREHVEAYVLHLQREAPSRKNGHAGQMPATVSISYRTLRGFFNWSVREDMLPRSPMEKMRAPSVPEEAVAIVREADFERLLRATAGTGFEARRDTALLRLLYDSGARRGELANLKLEDVDWVYNTISIAAEGSKSKRARLVPFGRKCAAALDRYLRARARHPYADQPWLWIGKRGQLSGSGLLQVIERRGSQAGIAKLHPHAFRHGFAHNLKSLGLASEDIMLLGGWKDMGTMARYGRSAGAERAIQAFRLISPGDRVG